MNKQDLQQKWDTLPVNNLMRLWQMEIAEVGDDNACNG